MRYLKLATIGAIYSVCMILMLTTMGFLFFNETLNRYEAAGIVFAIASIVLLSRFGGLPARTRPRPRESGG